MKKLILTKYEREILKAVESGKYEQVEDFEKLKKEMMKSAKYTLEKLKKEKNLNLRVAGSDLVAIKNKAMENGIPYQTMISTLLHQFATGKINIVL